MNPILFKTSKSYEKLNIKHFNFIKGDSAQSKTFKTQYLDNFNIQSKLEAAKLSISAQLESLYNVYEQWITEKHIKFDMYWKTEGVPPNYRYMLQSSPEIGSYHPSAEESDDIEITHKKPKEHLNEFDILIYGSYSKEDNDDDAETPQVTETFDPHTEIIFYENYQFKQKEDSSQILKHIVINFTMVF